MQRPNSVETRYDATDLSEILALYAAWFDADATKKLLFDGQPQNGWNIGLGGAPPDITQIEDTARRFLSAKLPSTIHVHFVLSVVESIAYTTSKFTFSDPGNAALYRAAALRILQGGLVQWETSNPKSLQGCPD
jgi:hypothetical protein